MCFTGCLSGVSQRCGQRGHLQTDLLAVLSSRRSVCVCRWSVCVCVSVKSLDYIVAKCSSLVKIILPTIVIVSRISLLMLIKLPNCVLLQNYRYQQILWGLSLGYTVYQCYLYNIIVFVNILNLISIIFSVYILIVIVCVVYLLCNFYYFLRCLYILKLICLYFCFILVLKWNEIF